MIFGNTRRIATRCFSRREERAIEQGEIDRLNQGLDAWPPHVHVGDVQHTAARSDDAVADGLGVLCAVWHQKRSGGEPLGQQDLFSSTRHPKRDIAQPNRPNSMISPIVAGYSTGTIAAISVCSDWCALSEDLPP